MSELNFIETNANSILSKIINELENGVSETLYAGDERRIFGETLAQVVVIVYNAVNDACRQRLLRYARGTVLDALGENRDVSRIESSAATTVIRFSVNEAVSSNIVIPAGTRVTGDFTLYFATDSTAVLYAGELYVDVEATAEEGGEDYNDIEIGEINQLVDTTNAPLIDYVSNITTTSGGGESEDDDSYRERIREAENRFSTAGPVNAYRYWALSADATISDVVVMSETEQLERTLTVHGGYAFKGGENLLEETLVVYLEDGTEAVEGTDYTAEYDDELLTIALSGALSDAETVDIEITRNMPGRVKIVPICAGGELPDDDILEKVYDACNADDVRPLTDHVTVETPDVVYYDIELVYYTTLADESEVIENVEGLGGAIDKYIEWQGSSLDQDINPDYLRKLILSPRDDDDNELAGATRVIITSPEYTELPNTTVAKHSGTLTVSHVVKE